MKTSSIILTTAYSIIMILMFIIIYNGKEVDNEISYQLNSKKMTEIEIGNFDTLVISGNIDVAILDGDSQKRIKVDNANLNYSFKLENNSLIIDAYTGFLILETGKINQIKMSGQAHLKIDYIEVDSMSIIMKDNAQARIFDASIKHLMTELENNSKLTSNNKSQIEFLDVNLKDNSSIIINQEKNVESITGEKHNNSKLNVSHFSKIAIESYGKGMKTVFN